MNSMENKSVKSFFTYNAKTYSGYVFGSTDILPHQYWFFFCDADLVAKMSDCIIFNQVEGRLNSIRSYGGNENIVNIIRGLIKNKLRKGDFIAEV